MVGCSEKDSEAVVDDNSTGILDGKAAGFFKVNINLPTTPVVSTRAWAEDGKISDGDPILNDGLGKEYGVNTCILMLFSGTAETNATLKQVIDITGTFNPVDEGTDPNQITTNYEKVVRLDNSLSGNIYALAVVNGKGNIEYASSSTVKVHIQGEEAEMQEIGNCTIANLQAKLSKSADVKTNDFIYKVGEVYYYFMTNAVLSNEKGGITQPSTADGNQHILAPVDKSYIYETEAKAQAGNAAVDIYVERGMAKVTIKSASLSTAAIDGTALGSGKLKETATLTGWCLDITNKSSYIVRQVPTGTFWNLCSFSTNAATDKYRFIGGNPVDGYYGTNKAGYRTYWALDPNYGTENVIPAATPATNKNEELFSYADFASDAIAEIGDNNPLYCLENTFDVAHQDARYTTRAIIGVKLTDDETFYIMGADRKTLYKESDVKAQVFQKLSESTMFTNWYNTAAIGNGKTLTVDDITITWDKTTAGVIKVEKITINHEKVEGDNDIEITTSAPSALADNNTESPAVTGVISTINEKMVNVERFVGGIAYYAIRIKHFGDDLTPWNVQGAAKEWNTTAPKESGIDDIYPNDDRRDANYLGRYGMVRNNWYELVIGDILKVGSAEPPVIPSHPDDDLEDNFIKARINILSWAKRPQTWNLK